MPDEFPVFEVFLNKRRRGWRWHVCTTGGDIVIRGSGPSRPAATYNAYRALFLLLQSAPYQSIRLSSSAGRGRYPSGRSRSRAYPRAGPDHDTPAGSSSWFGKSGGSSAQGPLDRRELTVQPRTGVRPWRDPAAAQW